MNSRDIELKDSLVLHKPGLHSSQRDGVHFLIDAEAPNWIATDARGAGLL